MAHLRTFIAAVLVCGALVAGVVASLSRAQAATLMTGSDGVHEDFRCTITAVDKSGDDVAGVTLAIDPTDKNAASWSDWLASSLNKSVWLGFSPHWQDRDDTGTVADNSGNVARIALSTAGTPRTFKAEVGETVHIFYGGEN